jgi:beta-phosphoglucomutase-like phosphatase (HAD superfamily)
MVNHNPLFTIPAAAPTAALIFDMDGTMIDSMPHHTLSWLEFCKRRGITIDVKDLLQRTTGRTGTECMGELFGRSMTATEALPLVHEKEMIYRELFAPVFKEVAGFTTFAAKARSMGLKIGVGTAGDKHNIAFAMSHLKMPHPPQVIVGGDQGFAGKPDPAIFLEAARAMNTPTSNIIVFEDAPFGIEAARRGGMRAVAICTSYSAAELAGPHVIASAKDYNELLASQFLDNLHIESNPHVA